MKILNLFAGLGGNRFLWRGVQVTAIEKNLEVANIYKKRFPDDKMIVTDVYDYLRIKTIPLDYDFIWASPPCQSHSQMQKFNPSPKLRMPIPRMDEIYGLLTWLHHNYTGRYAIENVQPYYKTPILPSARIDRHIFWANFPITPKTFREQKWTHGRIGGNMRKSIRVLVRENQLQDIFPLLERIPKDDRIVLIRNCVDPKVGLHVFNAFKASRWNLTKYMEVSE